MSKDTIDRQESIDALMEEFKRIPTNVIRAKNIIEGLPSAQPEITLESAIDYLHSTGWMQEHDRIMSASAQPDRKKGKWIPHKELGREYIGTVLVDVRYDYWLCDTCGYKVGNGQPTYNYCPNCGAQMEN